MKKIFDKLFSLPERYQIDPTELEFMSPVEAAYHRRGNVWPYRITMLLVGLFVLFLVGSCFITREEITRGEGNIIFSRGVQPIQTADGGIITEILVKENQVVAANATLARISNVQAIAEYQELLNKQVEYSLAIIRLEAEERRVPPVFSEAYKRTHPSVVRDQLRLYTAHLQQYEAEKSGLQSLLVQKQTEVEGAQISRQHTQKSLLLLKQQESRVRPLVGRSYAEMDYLRLKQRIVAQEGELNALAQTISRGQSAVREADGRLRNIEPERRNKIATEMNQNRKELDAVLEAITARSNLVDRSELKAPMRAVVKRILLKSDSVARQAETIMELLPLDDFLEVEARFRPEDRGFLEVGQNATIKITAYDDAVYGGLPAHVTRIGSDTVEDNKGRPWYTVRLKATTSKLPGKEDLEIMVGMTVKADVYSGNKSLFAYLMKPLLKSQQTMKVVGKTVNATNSTTAAGHGSEVAGGRSNATAPSSGSTPPLTQVTPIDPLVPADPLAPIDPLVPADPLAPIDPLVPADPLAPIDPLVPADPLAPIDPLVPADPLAPIDPLVPADPLAPIDPLVPADTGVPAAPVRPVPVISSIAPGLGIPAAPAAEVLPSAGVSFNKDRKKLLQNTLLVCENEYLAGREVIFSESYGRHSDFLGPYSQSEGV